MKKALVGFLCLIIIVFSVVSIQAETSAETALGGMRNVLMIVSLDKTLPKDGKTYAMGNYLIVLDEDNQVMKFTSFPYNLAVTVQTTGGEVTKQLQFVCNDLGPEGMAEVLEQNFGVTIDRWLLINMTGLADLVDLAGGIEVDLPDLSINKKASDLKYMTSIPYVKVAAPGLQVLNGIQMMAYISDTYYDQPTLIVEEGRFRERQQVLIRGIVSGLRNFQVDTEALLALVFDGFLGNFATDVPMSGMLSMGRANLAACLQNDPVFLHIPREIATVKASNGWESMGFTQEDVTAVQVFVGN